MTFAGCKSPGTAIDKPRLTWTDPKFPVERGDANAIPGTNRAGKTSLLEVIELKRWRMFTWPD